VVVNRVILAALVVVVLGALYALVGVSRPIKLSAAPPSQEVSKLTVGTGLLGCPAPGSAGVTGGGIALASLPTTTGAGQVTLTRLSPTSAGTVSHVSPRPGQLTVEHVPASSAVPKKRIVTAKLAGGAVPTGAARGGLIVSAAGANAQGLDVEQLGPGGQPTARCGLPGSDFWFVGPGSTTLHISLYLINTDSQPADAAVGIQTDSGPLLGAQDSGIEVPPHSMVVQTIDKLVHQAKAIALHVTTSTGRVVAAVRETTSAAKEGTWLPYSAEPSTDQVLAGLPSNAGARELYLTVPGKTAAQVKVTVITPHGSYQPTGGANIPVLSQQTSEYSIPSLAGLVGALRITSNVPVTATLETPGGPNGAPGAFVVGAAQLTGQGLVAASPGGKVGTTEVVLSAPGAAATVTIVKAVPGVPLTGQQGQTVHIKAKSSTEVRLELPKKDSKVLILGFVVTPQPGSGPVYAGRVAVIDNLVQTVLPINPSPAEVQLTPVHQSLLAVLGDGS
jgi:uncharacterized protein DUF5719